MISDRALWIARRNSRIGGSDAPSIMNACPWQTPFELWARKTGRLGAQLQNEAMRRGLELEPIARRAYELLTGIPMPAAELEHREHRFIGANLDGINREAGRVLEIKCPGPTDHAEAKSGRIPGKYLWQCVHLMMVADLPSLDYWSFDGWTGTLVTMTRDRALEEVLLNAEKAFWRHVTSDTPPPFEIPKVRQG